MEKKKIVFTIIVGVAAIVGIFFGWRKFQQIKISRQQPVVVSRNSITSIQDETRSGQEPVSATSVNNSQPTSLEDLSEIITQKKNDEQVANDAQSTSSKSLNNSPQKVESVVSSADSAAVKNGNDTGKIVQRVVSWGFQKSAERKIDTIILHSSYDALGNDPFSVSGVIAEYKQAQVSPHYLIARDGTIYQLVSDQNIAWHAGVAKMPDGRTDVNSFSIGVEIINTQTGKFTSAQYDSVNRLIGDLKNKYPIKNILGHSDIAPGRKTDPWGIEWKKVQK